MRSITFTILLALVAAITLGAAGLRIIEGDLARIMGSPATPIGERLYDFDPAKVSRIVLKGNGVLAVAERGEGGWEVTEPERERPWRDRMDPRIAQALLAFTLDTRVEGSVSTAKAEASSLVFEDSTIGVRIVGEAPESDPLALYVLGQRTAWFGVDPESGTNIPTVYVAPQDRGRDNFIYACLDPIDINGLLGNDFSRLRDHHPFLFHPNMIRSLRISNRSGELRLSRATPDELWKIVKPLELKTDKDAVLELIQGLYNLEAVRLRQRSEVTLPTGDASSREQIALQGFGSEEELVLEIHRTTDADDDDVVLASVSNRPDTIFELPNLPAPSADGSPGPTTLSGLPLSVNELRDPTLSAIDPAAVQAIRISPATSDDILIARDQPQERFRLLVEGKPPAEPNESALFSLLTTVTEGRVAGFVSDTATDLAPHGLDAPFLSIRFLAFDGTTIQIDFGEAPDGEIRAIRSGTTSVVRIDSNMLALIPTRPWEWRDPAVWRLATPDVAGIVRQIGESPPVALGYQFAAERWTAEVDGQNRSAELATDQANLLLDQLVNLRARHWLRPNHPTAQSALATPGLGIRVLIREYDELGEFVGTRIEELVVGANQTEVGTTFYGRSSRDPDPFLLDPEVIEKLAVDLFPVD